MQARSRCPDTLAREAQEARQRRREMDLTAAPWHARTEPALRVQYRRVPTALSPRSQHPMRRRPHPSHLCRYRPLSLDSQDCWPYRTLLPAAAPRFLAHFNPVHRERPPQSPFVKHVMILCEPLGDRACKRPPAATSRVSRELSVESFDDPTRKVPLRLPTARFVP